ncbi:DNA-binding transcriptional regulator [Thalassococcus sp. S3]|uniref:helix-turn-helix domain-containing protein n=1 Tax=Thalassococcus sp. S3 TaxID=2017482 RepID=UPI0010244157|nr:transcriptional regulator [Thalassococcus sp. S3]QBF31562.1 transcriptional regulator [Thalassococcus sp. S3]
MGAQAKRKDIEADRDAAALAEVQADIDGSAPLEPVVRFEVPMVDVRALRERLGMTQKRFSEHFGFALAAVRNWEQRRRLPDRSARILLRVIAEDPQRVEKIIRMGG